MRNSHHAHITAAATRHDGQMKVPGAYWLLLTFKLQTRVLSLVTVVVLGRVMGSARVWAWVHIVESSTALAAWVLLVARLSVHVQPFAAGMLSRKHPQSPLAWDTERVEGRIMLACKRRNESWTELGSKGEREKQKNRPSQIFPFFLNRKQLFLSLSMSFFGHLLAIFQYQKQARKH